MAVQTVPRGIPLEARHLFLAAVHLIEAEMAIAREQGPDTALGGKVHELRVRACDLFMEAKGELVLTGEADG